MSTLFTVTVKATSVTVSPGEESVDYLQPLLDLFQYEDEFTETTNVLGYIYDKETDILYLHKGVDIGYLKRLLINVKIVFDLYDDYKPMNFEYEEIIPPRDDEQIDYIDFISGTKGHAENSDENQVFLTAAPGKGKEEPYSRKIPTPTKSGYTLMGDLKIGDSVYSRDGSITTVMSIFEQGVKPIYKLTFHNDDRFALCGYEHLWNVKRIDETSYHEMTTRELIDDNDGVYDIQLCESVQYPSRDVPIDPWVMGCFIMNGLLYEKKLSIYSEQLSLVCEIAKICNYEIKADDFTRHVWHFTKNERYISTNEFFSKVPRLIDRRLKNVRIPIEYMINDDEVRNSLLKGIYRANNGCLSHNITSTSKKLLRQISSLCYSLGKSCHIKKNESDDNKYTLYLDFNSTSLRIKSIRKTNTEEQCRCILVDNGEHLYLTEDYIVTHNTYCSSVGMCKLKMKTLIIMHRDTLRNQWMKSICNMAGLSSHDVHEITSSEELYNIAIGNYDEEYDVYLMTHATFRSGLKRIGSFKLASNIAKNLGIGTKIIDEAHLEFKDTLLIDFLFNIKRNVYLTATAGRSSKDENSIFKHVFANAIMYKPSYMLTNNMPKKWVDYTTVFINTHCNPNIYRYRVAGGRGMNPASYGKWVIQYDKKQNHMKVCRDILHKVYEKDEKAKVIIFMPLIDLCSETAYFLNMALNYDESFPYQLDIKIINSKNTKTENEMNKRADVIVTTITSCGTGTDISGITTIICCSPYVSKITAEQVFGRIRYCGKVCDYFDIVDKSVLLDEYWWKSRSKKMKELALNVRTITWTDDEEETQK